ncbi:MAG: TlpA family protein disulfide reductase [Sphingomicrobium sp.]|nr:TlpA family protein disulfide reductase [Sphingomonadales bacterium]
MRLIVLLLVGGLALGGCDRQKAPEQQGIAPAPKAAQMPVKGLDRSHAGDPIPDIVIKDGNGEDTALTEFKGSPLLVNLWASWCVPCVKELPTLDRLAVKRGAPEIVALSQDSGPLASVAAFLGEHGIKRLDTYQDADTAMSEKSGAQVLPTSILYDKDGREVWRFVGDRDWTSAEAAKDLAAAG